jgi:hypothetical protein
MAELTVENLHLTYGDNPILKGFRSPSIVARSCRCWALRERQDDAAARGGRSRDTA